MARCRDCSAEIENGSSYCQKCHLGWRLLGAAKERDMDQIRELLGEGADVNARNSDGYTALHIAALFGYPDVAQCLLERGADPNTHNAWGSYQWTPLHDAAAHDRQGNFEVLRLLLDAGAKVGVKDRFGKTPYKVARSKMNLVQALVLLKHDAPRIVLGCLAFAAVAALVVYGIVAWLR